MADTNIIELMEKYHITLRYVPKSRKILTNVLSEKDKEKGNIVETYAIKDITYREYEYYVNRGLVNYNYSRFIPYKDNPELGCIGQLKIQHTQKQKGGWYAKIDHSADSTQKWYSSDVYGTTAEEAVLNLVERIKQKLEEKINLQNRLLL